MSPTPRSSVMSIGFSSVAARTTTEMALRWAAAGMLAAQAQFRRVKGHRQLPELARALEKAVGYQADTPDIPHAVTG
jgi:hypothetical protein